MKKALKVFISYSSKDTKVMDELLAHLSPLERNGGMVIFSDKKLIAGDRWDDELKKFTQEADIFVFLVSPDSLSSTFIANEIQIAISRQRLGISKIIPVLIRQSNWKSSELAQFRFIPQDLNLKPVITKSERNAIFEELYLLLKREIEVFDEPWEVIIRNEIKERTGILNLINQNLSSIPDPILEMKWLKSLTLTNNQIENFSLLGQLTGLEKIDLSYNNISIINGISRLKKLRSLDLRRNKITAISGLENLEQLINLNISDNRIVKISGLDTLTRLNTLNLSVNGIKKIEGLESLENLHELDLYKNKIARIEGLNKNTRLTMLGLSTNNLTALTNISQLKDLETLYLAHNKIEDISELQKLKKLKRIVLTDNKINDLFPLKEFIEKDIPIKGEYSFDSLEPGFFVKDNPIHYPPMEVVLQGKDAILRNFAQQEDAVQEQLDPYQSKEVKLILIGNANVGKTHIATYIKSNKKELPENNASTHGMINDFVHYPLPSLATPVKMRILDFGGQEYYHDTHHLFFTNDTIYLLLWEKDSNRFGSKVEKRFSVKTGKIEEETNTVFPLAYWLDAVNYFLTRSEQERKKSSTKSPDENTTTSTEQVLDPSVIMVETKRNKNGYSLLDTTSILKYKNIIHSQAAISLYRDENKKMIHTGTDSLFDSLHDLLGSMFEKKWSGYYQLLVNFFDNITDSENTEILKKVKADGLIVNLHHCINLFNKIIRKNNYKYTFDNDHALDLCRFLANRGYILFFDSKKICLHPDELTREIYTVLKKEYKSVGMITNQEAKEYSEKVIDIMQDFKLLIPHPAGTGYIAPQLLPENTNNELNMFLDVFTPPVMRFSIAGYIHKNIIQELFYSFKESFIKEDTINYIWKNGFIIKIQNELYKINIRSSEDSRLIEIQYNKIFDISVLLKISTLITEALAGRLAEKEVSLDGKLFVPVNLIQSNIQLSQISYKGSLLRIADYKKFLDPDAKQSGMKKLFISYSSKNTDFMRRFETHLEPLKRNGDIDFWHDRMIEPGTRWDETIKKELELSEIIIFLLSPEFIANNYVFEIEIPQAMKQYTAQVSKLFFVELQACNWEKTDLFKIQQLTDPTAPNKKLVTISDPLNDTKWIQVIKELEKKLK